MPLAFRPACRPLARGGLPHPNAQAAHALLHATTPEVLSFPALMRRLTRDGGAIYCAAGFPGLTLDPRSETAHVRREGVEALFDRLALAYLRRDHSVAMPNGDQVSDLAEFLRSLHLPFRGAALKSETLGPFSLALMLIDEHERALIYASEVLEALVQHVALRARWQAAHLREYCSEVIMCLDEPMIDGLRSAFCPLSRNEALGMIARVLHDIEGRRGLLVEGMPDWPTLMELNLDLLVCGSPDRFPDGADAEYIGYFLKRGGAIGWGVVSLDATSQQVPQLVERFGRLVRHLEQHGVERDQLLQQSFITLAANPVRLSVGEAEQALHTCAQTAFAVRKHYQLERVA